MNLWHAVILGIVQGIGEFAPISSSGHLIAMPVILGWDFDQGLTFDVALHFGTLLALLVYFYKDLLRLLGNYFAEMRAPNGFLKAQYRYILPVFLGCFPAALAGFLLEETVATKFRSPLLVAFDMAFMGAVLFMADRLGKKKFSIRETGPAQWLAVGVSQALALFPGVSRSGVTITAGLVVGMKRDSAARFSFLLSIPIIFGASAYEGLKLAKKGIPSDERSAFIVGIITATVFGYLCIKFLLSYLRTRSVNLFVWYRFAFSTVLLATYFLRK